jgi:hypothetical protein
MTASDVRTSFRRIPARSGGQLRALLLRHDPQLLNARRAARAAVVVPAIFAVADEGIGNAQVALFAAFGAISMLLFADFSGPMRERLLAYVGLIAAGLGLVCLGTICSETLWLAVSVTAVATLAVLFVGIVSSLLASATTALVVSFLIGVALKGPVSSVPDRVEGWLLAGGVALLSVRFLWPAPVRDPLRLLTADACDAIAGRLHAEVDCSEPHHDHAHTGTCSVAAQRSSAALSALRTGFYAAPYRPTGVSTGARRLVHIIDQTIWLGTVLDRRPVHKDHAPLGDDVLPAQRTTAELLGRTAGALRTLQPIPGGLDPLVEAVEAARSAMESRAIDLAAARLDDGGDREDDIVAALHPAFRAQESAYATVAIAQDVDLVRRARTRRWLDVVLGRDPDRDFAFLAPVGRRAASHFDRHSVWLRNSVRGAVAFALAIFVADEVGVQHSFWVAFGTLAVLRSSAVSTGQTALRALAGTAVGIIIGGGIVAAVGTDHAALWTLLPFAVFAMGFAPAAISFAAGQAGFTTALFILFSLIQPAGWRLGIVRAEDIAIGCAVSVVAGLLCWPRGAGAVLRQALAEGLLDAARDLLEVVDSIVDTTTGGPLSSGSARGTAAARAGASRRRLDGAFRQYLLERGTKRVGLAELTSLVTAVSVTRYTADAIRDVWSDVPARESNDSLIAADLRGAGRELVDRYDEIAVGLLGLGTPPDLLNSRSELLLEARRDFSTQGGLQPAATIRLVWTAGHLTAAYELQRALVPALDALSVSPSPSRVGLGARRRALAHVGSHLTARDLSGC